MSHLDIAIELAKEAGAIQHDNLGKMHDIEYKIETDIVTDIDKKCEKLIVTRLQKEFPGHDIMAEEGTGNRLKSDYRWIIDPLDGTLNYAHGYPLFAVSIALEYKGYVVLGVAYESNHDELFVAEKGSGSTLNGRRIKVSETKELRKALLDTGFAYNKSRDEQKNNAVHFLNFLDRAASIRRDGAAVTDLCSVACGRFDGFWELYLKPWDIAAGQLIVKEAGGSVTMFNGGPLDIYGIEILASNGRLHKEMVNVLCLKK
ncbi:MAG: inositol monophosphatase [Deltaproteobacteria bacterium CG11_big_fil_rev_8_21_14_0_20_49_13]|nr:MAG: inositol monophosphatase [Deltaproteobacteria bacterium CG11_big_fil_rev_8_21_14_0_20_49_13]